MVDQEHKAASSHPEAALEHMEQEFHDLEGDTGTRKWLSWVIGVFALVAVAATFWFFPSVGKEAPVVSGGLVIQTFEPRQGKLAATPDGFRWQSIAGRHDYVFKLFVEGAPSPPLLERWVKEPMLRLTSEERAQVVRGKAYVWTVTARSRDGSAIGAGKAKFQIP